MAYKQWKLEQEALENAFARRLLVEYNIKEVTTQRQAKNETRVFEFPVPSRYFHLKGERFASKIRLRLACFKSGYVRNQNSCSSNYQLNPVYRSEERQMFLTDNGVLKTYKYDMHRRTKIWNSMARLKFMLDFYIRNYKLNTNK
jgi:hypothetical protein|tara:strand:- start:1381 stop:1812 length:432 start_codon:yes stop_codon:yes gene_type:complete